MDILGELLQQISYGISGPPQPGAPHLEITRGEAAPGEHILLAEAEAEAS